MIAPSNCWPYCATEIPRCPLNEAEAHAGEINLLRELWRENGGSPKPPKRGWRHRIKCWIKRRDIDPVEVAGVVALALIVALLFGTVLIQIAEMAQ